MPKIVDVDQRKAEISAALLRVAARDGVAATSVRAVGREAGMSAGALRHYFSSQDELLVFALRQLDDAIRSQLETWQWSGVGMDDALQLLEMVLPMDERSRGATRVWFEVTALLPARPVLRPVWEETYWGTRQVCRGAVGMVVPALGEEPADSEAARLHLLVDGLALHGSYLDEVGSQRIRDELRVWLDELVARYASQ